jgi:hypothetical protein
MPQCRYAPKTVWHVAIAGGGWQKQDRGQEPQASRSGTVVESFAPSIKTCNSVQYQRAESAARHQAQPSRGLTKHRHSRGVIRLPFFRRKRMNPRPVIKRLGLSLCCADLFPRGAFLVER